MVDYASKYWGITMAEEEAVREKNFPLVHIQTAIAWFMVRAFCTEDTETILDAGAGAGRYSIPLAKSGYDVTHLDISKDMIETANTISMKEGVKEIRFIQGDICNMDVFQDREFDMTLCFDAPISYTFPNQKKAIKELLRVTNSLVMLMVSNRNGVIPFMIDFDISGEYLDPAWSLGKRQMDPFYITKKVMEKGVEEWPRDIKSYLEESGKDAPADYSFKVDEIVGLIEENSNFEVVKIGGPGALARSIKPESLETIIKDDRLFSQFIELSLEYDFDKFNIGLGAVNLLIVAKRK